jgi:phosphopantothenoylcysteine decarboxylase/phosphopantothenate--cysteine ligase
VIVAAVGQVISGGAVESSPPVVRARDLEGIRVLVTAGGTREPIDPVRYITNRSSGKQGHAIAQAAESRGARVSLVTAARIPADGVSEVIRVDTAAEMEAAVLELAPGADVIVMAAAVSDFRPKVPRIKSSTSKTASPTSSSSRPPTYSPNSAGPGVRIKSSSDSQQRRVT